MAVDAAGNPILDRDSITAFQSWLGVPGTGEWDPATQQAFKAFQQAKGWGDTYGLTGDHNEWANLVKAVQTSDRAFVGNQNSAVIAPGPRFAPTPGPSAPNPPSTPSGSSQQSARAMVEGLLREWGLESLSGWAWEQIQNGNSELLPILIRQTEQYKQRFSGLEARRAAGLNVMSEAEYLNLENNYRLVMRRYGIPQGAFDTQDYLGNLIARDLSPAELNDRLRIYQDAALQAPAEVRNQLQRYYGVSEGGLIAYFIDPNKALPVLEAQYATAGAGSASVRGGFGQLEESEASRLAQLGADAGDVATFEQLSRSAELFTGLGGAEYDQSIISREAAAEGAFGGNADAKTLMERRARQRVAVFGGGGGALSSNKGVTGLGSAST